MKNYKEKYEQALERARNIRFGNPQSGTANVVCEEIFPELKESEDERIRKRIIEFLSTPFVKKGMSEGALSTWIAWLEKQGEKKLSVNCLLSWSEIDEKMLQSLEGIVKDYWTKAEQEKNEIKIREANNVSCFLKTIQKSPLCWIKCSDELPNRDGTYLVVTDGSQNDVYDMAKYDSIDGWHKASEILYWMPIPQLNNKSIIEQKPVWSEEDAKKIKLLIAILEVNHPNGQFKVNPINTPNMEVMSTEELVDWLKSLKQRMEGACISVTDEELAQAKNDAYIDALDKIEYHSGEPTFDDGWSAAIWYLKKKNAQPQNTWKPSDGQMK